MMFSKMMGVDSSFIVSLAGLAREQGSGAHPCRSNFKPIGVLN